jgi:hypothetical protein
MLPGSVRRLAGNSAVPCPRQPLTDWPALRAASGSRLAALAAPAEEPARQQRAYRPLPVRGDDQPLTPGRHDAAPARPAAHRERRLRPVEPRQVHPDRGRDELTPPARGPVSRPKPGRVVAALTRVPSAKIVSQDWIGQAERLASAELIEPEGQQKYATFHIQLLIDPDNRQHRPAHQDPPLPDRHRRQLARLGRPAPHRRDSPQSRARSRARAASQSTPRPARRPPPIHAEGASPAEEGHARHLPGRQRADRGTRDVLRRVRSRQR